MVWISGDFLAAWNAHRTTSIASLLGRRTCNSILFTLKCLNQTAAAFDHQIDQQSVVVVYTHGFSQKVDSFWGMIAIDFGGCACWSVHRPWGSYRFAHLLPSCVQDWIFWESSAQIKKRNWFQTSPFFFVAPVFPGFEVYQHGSLMLRLDYCQILSIVSSCVFCACFGKMWMFFVSSPPPAPDAGTWAGFLPRRRRRRTGEGGIFWHHGHDRTPTISPFGHILAQKKLQFHFADFVDEMHMQMIMKYGQKRTLCMHRHQPGLREWPGPRISRCDACLDMSWQRYRETAPNHQIAQTCWSCEFWAVPYCIRFVKLVVPSPSQAYVPWLRYGQYAGKVDVDNAALLQMASIVSVWQRHSIRKCWLIFQCSLRSWRSYSNLGRRMLAW